MKKLKLLALPLAFLLFLAACTKEGPVGPVGPAGTNGTNGTNGNANVIVVNHPLDSLSSSHGITVTLPASVTGGMIDSGLILVYYFGDGGCDYWYQSPGLSCNSSYQTRWYYYKNSNSVYLLIKDPDGSAYAGSTRILTKTKVVIATGTTFLSGKKDIDFSNYEEVKRYLNLKD